MKSNEQISWNCQREIGINLLSKADIVSFPSQVRFFGIAQKFWET